MLANLEVLEGVSACTGFEGPEKRLEINFKTNNSNYLGLRSLGKEQWQQVCDLARCTIISHSKTDYFDAFVLSESSLFVFDFKLMMKTCGTTALLNVIPKIMELTETMGLEPLSIVFSRKNFVFPAEQPHPHTDWKSEVEYLNSWFDGTAYVLGPLTQAHWYLYVADYSNEECGSAARDSEKTLEIMMHNLDPVCAGTFCKKDGQGEKEKYPGVADLISGQETDEFNFTPCGYSMNGLLDDSYMTIHVTPEAHCSYASVETNLSLPSYSSFISKSLALFKPGTITLSFVHKKSSASAPRASFDLDIAGYVLKHKTFMEVDGNAEVTLCNYESIEFANQAKRRKAKTAPKNLITASAAAEFISA